MREYRQNSVGKWMGFGNYWLNNVTSCFTLFYSSGCRTHEPLAATRRRMNLQSRAESPTEQHGWYFSLSNSHPSSLRCFFLLTQSKKIASILGTISFQIFILFHFAVLSFDTIQVNCFNTWYFFFSNVHPSSFCCSFFWHNPRKLPQVLRGRWNAGLQLSRLQRLRDHPRARLRQGPTQGEVGETKMSKLWKIYSSSTAWKGSGRTTRPRSWSSCGPLTGGSRAW